MALLPSTRRANKLAQLPPPPDETRYSITDWLALTTYSYGGNVYNLTLPMQQYPDKGESAPNSFDAYVAQAYKAGGIVFAVSMARALVFSEVRFQFRNLSNKRLFGGSGLNLLEHPWPNGTTGELLLRAEQDVTLGGNFYARIMPDRLVRMEPNKVKILLGSTDGELPHALNSFVAGYVYYPDGPGTNDDKNKITLKVEEVVHWSPIPDPQHHYIGMSWLTPAIQDVMIDVAATKSKQSFFDHAMTPNFGIVFPPQVATSQQFNDLREAMETSHAGAQNAFKTLYLAAGAQPVPLGVDPKTGGLIDIQSVSETRVCADGRVPAVIVGFTTGLEAATYSNFGQARRQLADGFARPQWRSFCAAMAKAVSIPPGAELWYDESDVAMLREDAKQAADTTTTHMTSIVAGVNGGFDPQSVIDAVTAGDLTLLVHTGLTSVQLQAPISDDAKTAEAERQALDALATIVNKIANGPAPGVGRVITAEEARQLLVGAGLPISAAMPSELAAPPTPPAPAPDSQQNDQESPDVTST